MYGTAGLILLTCSVISTIIAQDAHFDGQVYDPAATEANIPGYPSASDEEYYRHIHSMINAYRSDVMGGRLVIETNSLIDTKYKTWKRNADLINSLLSLPKGMNDAGR